jgi:hypothetical protein
MAYTIEYKIASWQVKAQDKTNTDTLKCLLVREKQDKESKWNTNITTHYNHEQRRQTLNRTQGKSPVEK